MGVFRAVGTPFKSRVVMEWGHVWLDQRWATTRCFLLIAGPCVVESESLVMRTAEFLKTITERLGIPFVFKSSYKKANRTRPDAFTGIGDVRALEILARVREAFQVPVLTDFHTPGEAHLASQYVDILQVPAFLCRQTDLIVAGARTGKPLNLKKGQFVSAQTMKFAVEKAWRAGARNVWLTERGTFFGYGDLVVDFRNIPWMHQLTGCPIIMDCTHATQQPGALRGASGGQRQFAELYARCGLVAGASGIFMEVHPDPDHALSDGPNMLPLSWLPDLLERLVALYDCIQEHQAHVTYLQQGEGGKTDEQTYGLPAS